MSDATSEHELFDRCLSGDEAAWAELITRYRGLIYAVPRRIGLSPEDSGDVFQRVCLLLYQRLDSIRDPNRLGGWLLTTATREAIRVSRRSRRDVPIDSGRDDKGTSAEDAVPDIRPLPDDERETIERSQMLRSALLELSERCRVLLEEFLRDDGANYRDVARRLDIPIGSIGPTRARCFSRLREVLVERGFTGISG